MLPCSSSAQMEGCEEERESHMQTECNRLTEERDEAQRQLKHIKRVSQMVIEEVSVLQTQLEIEKSCRENAEALATKLNCENRKLKYLSLSSRPCLDDLLPSISDCIPLEADRDAADTVDNSPDAFTQCQQQVKDSHAVDNSPDSITLSQQQVSSVEDSVENSSNTFTLDQHQIKELRETVNSLLEEKKNFVCQIHEQQRRIEELTTQSEKDQVEMKQLRETVEQQSKTIKRFNRVSMMAAQEYEGMKEQLDLEQNLRVKAETYAHEMLVKQKEANRQSMLLLQSAEPSIQLLKALEDVAAITKILEEERLQHQQKVQSLEAQLEQSCVKKQLEDLQRQLELLEVEKKEVEGRLEQAEKKNKELENKVHELQEIQEKIAKTTQECTPAPGVAPPPAPLPQPPPPSRCNPLSSLIAIMKKSSKGSKAAVKVEEPPAAEGVDDVKVKAVNEMMERIKHGVVLRPVKSQDTKQPPPCEEKPQESAMDELKGILETVKRSPSRGSQDSGPPPPGKKDSELEVILRRRRNKAGEAGSGGGPDKVANESEQEGQMSHVSSSDSLNGRRASSDSGKHPEGAGGLVVPSDHVGPRVSPERRGSGPGPVLAWRKSSDTGKEKMPSSSPSEKKAAEPPVSNGCINSVGEEDQIKSNGVNHSEAGGDTHTSICTGSTDAEC